MKYEEPTPTNVNIGDFLFFMYKDNYEMLSIKRVDDLSVTGINERTNATHPYKNAIVLTRNNKILIGKEAESLEIKVFENNLRNIKKTLVV